jgi:hypothetical protein
MTISDERLEAAARAVASMHGGSSQTYRALWARGLLDSKTDTLTPAGEMEARAIAARRPSR